VLAATDLVRLIGEQVNLRPKGKEFVGLCPFHDDKTPSMYVSPQKQIFKCFVCGAGGTAFDFAMNYHKMEFGEAMKYLAERGGVELTPWKGPGAEGPGSPGPSERKRIAAANELAVNFYRALLKHEQHGAEARAYLERRGVSAEMIETFGLGYAPDRWDGLVTMVREKGWDRGGFEAAQLIRSRKTGDGDFDFLRHRLVFPIFDAIGRPIAFGGRKLRDEDEPKYLNSPETVVFNKSKTLYGLHAAKKPIIDTKTAVIVEGYTDVIACHQSGATNVVAALGTALTAEHVRELRRYCEQVVLVMDGDAAGQKAADRAIEVFLTGNLDVSIAVLPGGQDPDELLKAGGLAAWDQVLAGGRDALTYAFDRVAGRLDEAETVTGRQRVAEEFMDQLVDLGLARSGEVRRAFVVERLARLLGMSEAAVHRALSSRSPRPPRNGPRNGPRSAAGSRAVEAGGPMADRDRPGSVGGGDSRGFDGSDPDNPPVEASPENEVHQTLANAEPGHRLPAVEKAEKRLVAALMRDPTLFGTTLDDGTCLDEAISPAELSRDDHRRLYGLVYDALAEGRPVSLAGLLSELAMRGEHDLIRLATTADQELEHTLPTTLKDETQPAPPSALREHLTDAARVILEHRAEREYQRQRNHLLQPKADRPGEPDEAARMAQRLAEMRRDRPHAARIPRI
ncbi:MAG: DNA primase, partial [Planctomycetota bacterium]